jgi:hypothetical protein
MPFKGMCNPVPVAYWSHTRTLLPAHDLVDPQ